MLRPASSVAKDFPHSPVTLVRHFVHLEEEVLQEEAVVEKVLELSPVSCRPKLVRCARGARSARCARGARSAERCCSLRVPRHEEHRQVAAAVVAVRSNRECLVRDSRASRG